jgi:hypothetical protein
MKKLVIIPGGFHPFHAGHMALYNSVKDAYPGADVFVAATDDKSSRPFPFSLKQKLATLAGVPANRFIQVKSPFRANEITQMYDPDDTVLIFVRSEKDRSEQPQAGGTKKDGSASYLQPLPGRNRQPMSKHGYMTYMPTVQFGGMTSATEIRNKWPEMEPEQKQKLIATLYPGVAGNAAALDKVVEMFDQVIGKQVGEAKIVNTDSGVDIIPDGGMGTWNESTLVQSLARDFANIGKLLKIGGYAGVEEVLYNRGAIEAKVRALGQFDRFMEKRGKRSLAVNPNKAIDITKEAESSPDYIEEKWSDKYKRSIDCSNPKGFSQKAHCAGRKKK